MLLTACLAVLFGCAEAQTPEAAFPEALAKQPAPAEPAVPAPAPAAKETEVPPANPEGARKLAEFHASKDVINLVIGKEIDDSYRLTFQVDDGNSWAATREIPEPLAALHPSHVLKHVDGRSYLMVNSVFVADGDLLHAAKLVKEQLSGATVPMLSPDGNRVEFTFIGDKDGQPGSVVVLDLKMYKRYVALVGLVSKEHRNVDVRATEMSVRLAAATIRVQ